MGIIIKPIVTEKQVEITKKIPNRVGFRVSVDFNKVGIRKTIEELYNVKVIHINTMKYKGKRKSRHTKSGVTSGRRSSFKKAIVTLNSGDVIDVLKNI